MKYFDVKFIIETDDNETTDSLFDKLEELSTKYDITYSGGIVEVDSEGNPIKEVDSAK